AQQAMDAQSYLAKMERLRGPDGLELRCAALFSMLERHSRDLGMAAYWTIFSSAMLEGQAPDGGGDELVAGFLADGADGLDAKSIGLTVATAYVIQAI